MVIFTGYRIIPIQKNLSELLKSYIKILTTEYLFTNHNDTSITKSGLRRMWESIIKAVNDVYDGNGKIYFTPHQFRHTYATKLYMANVDAKTT